MTADGRHVWLYAVTGPGAEPDVDKLAGVGGEAVRAVRTADFTAIVSDVAAARYGEQALRANLEDLHWLETTAREHHAVIEEVAGSGPVLPMRLATVYDGDTGLVTSLTERAADLHRALDRVRSCREWGLRGYVIEPVAGPAGLGEAGHAGGGPPPGPGAAYLQRRRAQLTARETRRREAASSAQAVYAELSHVSVAARLYPPQSAELSGEPNQMVLNAAYLVAEDRTGEFREAMTALADQQPSLQLVLTGPWPAYSFVGDTGGQDVQ